MSLIAEAIVKPNERTVGYAEKLLTGITPDNAGRLPQGANGPIQTNHPAFVYGHLALYPARVMEFLDRDPSSVAVADGWEDLFKPGAECRDDADGSLYPAFESLTQAFFDGYQAARAALVEADESMFSKPVPHEGYREAFGTLNVAFNFLMNNHIMIHLGQLSAWRRAMGMQPV
jgi:hypothetical protein